MSKGRRALSRREAIAGAAAAGAGAGLFVLLRGGPDEADSAVSATPDCVLAPEQTEGPHSTDNPLVRADIRDGRTGVPLSLRLQVVDASTCKPIRGATV